MLSSGAHGTAKWVVQLRLVRLKVWLAVSVQLDPLVELDQDRPHSEQSLLLIVFFSSRLDSAEK